MVRTASLALLFLGVAAAGLLWLGSGQNDRAALAQTSSESRSWTFPLIDLQDVPREGGGKPMLGLLFDVDAFGTPSLNQSWKLRGTPPRFRSHPDSARIYRWDLLSERGVVLASGRHLDKIALYTSSENGPCLKSSEKDHGMLIRCAFQSDLHRVRLTLESSQTAHDGEHSH